MPSKAVSICTYPGCTTLVKGGRCGQHPYPRRPDTRPSSHRRGYDLNWQRTRGAYLKANPYCSYNRKCRPGTLATEVDHVVSLADGGTSQWHNLRAACKPCHSSKTARQDTPRQAGQFHNKPVKILGHDQNHIDRGADED